MTKKKKLLTKKLPIDKILLSMNFNNNKFFNPEKFTDRHVLIIIIILIIITL